LKSKSPDGADGESLQFMQGKERRKALPRKKSGIHPSLLNGTTMVGFRERIGKWGTSIAPQVFSTQAGNEGGSTAGDA